MSLVTDSGTAVAPSVRRQGQPGITVPARGCHSENAVAPSPQAVTSSSDADSDNNHLLFHPS